jgi:hypothetical protein
VDINHPSILKIVVVGFVTYHDVVKHKLSHQKKNSARTFMYVSDMVQAMHTLYQCHGILVVATLNEKYPANDL